MDQQHKRAEDDFDVPAGVGLSKLARVRKYVMYHVTTKKKEMKKEITTEYQEHPRQKNWHACGYDTTGVPPNCGMVKSGLEENCVWDPNRIQIINNISPLPVQPTDQSQTLTRMVLAVGAATLTGLFVLLGRN